MDIEVRKAMGSRRPFAGRRGRTPEDGGDALVLIAQACRKWKGVVGVLLPGGKPVVPLPPKVLKRLQEAEAVVRGLAEEVEK